MVYILKTKFVHRTVCANKYLMNSKIEKKTKKEKIFFKCKRRCCIVHTPLPVYGTQQFCKHFLSVRLVDSVHCIIFFWLQCFYAKNFICAIWKLQKYRLQCNLLCVQPENGKTNAIYIHTHTYKCIADIHRE